MTTSTITIRPAPAPHYVEEGGKVRAVYWTVSVNRDHNRRRWYGLDIRSFASPKCKPTLVGQFDTEEDACAWFKSNTTVRIDLR